MAGGGAVDGGDWAAWAAVWLSRNIPLAPAAMIRPRWNRFMVDQDPSRKEDRCPGRSLQPLRGVLEAGPERAPAVGWGAGGTRGPRQRAEAGRGRGEGVYPGRCGPRRSKTAGSALWRR